MNLLIACSVALSTASAPPKQPHIVMLLADDYGWANFGQHFADDYLGDSTSIDPDILAQARKEVHTPNMDALVNDGILLDRHYSYKICGPSRASLQSGRLATHVNIKNTSPIVHNASDPVSGYAGIPRNMSTIALKMREANYRTAMTGKWDAGMATPEHTPLGRGYEQFYGYYQHANSYWSKGTGMESTGELDICMNKLTDLSIENATYRGGELNPAALDSTCDHGGNDTDCYEEHLFKENGLRILDEHDPSQPLYYFHSFHLVHTPLDVPQSYVRKAEERIKPYQFDDSGRRNYSAMVHYMDDVVGELTQKLKAKGMWEDTVMVFMADNGGPIYKPGSGNNYPLRGGKYNDFDGGIRTNAFVTGGFVPPASRGTTYSGVVSIADWYGMFSELAGVDPTDHMAKDANKWLEPRGLPVLPPIDSTSGLWSAMTGDNQNRIKNLRPVLHQSDNTVIQWPYKLITGVQPYAAWTGPLYPNCSGTTDTDAGLKLKYAQPFFDDSKMFGEKLVLSEDQDTLNEMLWNHDCKNGCLFNLEQDPTEHVDLALQSNPAVQAKLRELQELLVELNKSMFVPYRGEMSSAACEVGVKIGNYYGPFVDTDSYYTGPFPQKSPEQHLKDAVYMGEVEAVSIPSVRQGAVGAMQLIWPVVGPHVEDNATVCLPMSPMSTPALLVGNKIESSSSVPAGHSTRHALRGLSRSSNA